MTALEIGKDVLAVSNTGRVASRTVTMFSGALLANRGLPQLFSGPVERDYGILVGDGAGQDDLVVPDDRRRAAGAR